MATLRQKRVNLLHIIKAELNLSTHIFVISYCFYAIFQLFVTNILHFSVNTIFTILLHYATK